jgi:hypothetical protein
MKILNTYLTTQPFSRANKKSLFSCLFSSNEIVAAILKFNVGGGVNAQWPINISATVNASSHLLSYAQ